MVVNRYKDMRFVIVNKSDNKVFRGYHEYVKVMCGAGGIGSGMELWNDTFPYFDTYPVKYYNTRTEAENDVENLSYCGCECEVKMASEVTINELDYAS